MKLGLVWFRLSGILEMVYSIMVCDFGIGDGLLLPNPLYTHPVMFVG